ncbi:MAG: LysE family translocator [Gammaproteobacteria bacterium]|nr:LysE family translocator [Gammaproteobacteria bacterium]
MEFMTWLAYVLAATLVIIIPGPTILLVVTHSMRHGKASTLPLVAGVAAGDFLAMLLSLAGLGVVMAASATLFSIFKFIGAAYLIYLGISLWRSESLLPDIEATDSAVKGAGLFRQAFVVTALNPKGIIFFIAFLPQFVNPQGDRLTQLIVLGATFLIIATLNALFYSVFARRVAGFIKSPQRRRRFNRGGGAALVCAGLVTATAQRAA